MTRNSSQGAREGGSGNSLPDLVDYVGMSRDPHRLAGYEHHMRRLIGDIAALADEDLDDQTPAAVYDPRWT